MIAATEFVRTESEQRGRQTQVWVRDDAGTWRVKHAHLSMLDE